MRHSPLALALLLTFCSGVSARTDQILPAAKSQQRAIYLVDFVEPPLASFRGDAGGQRKLAGLKATSPSVTGARKLDASSPDSLAYRAALASLREDRLASAGARLGRVLEPLFVYEVVANGVALELGADEAAKLATLEGVMRVEPDFLRRPMTDAGPRWINADALWDGSAGITTRGEGVVVGIIDSGVNRTHPSFAATGPVDAFVHSNPKGRLFGRCADALTAGDCNNKLIGLWDYTICTGVHANASCNDREANDGTDGTGHGTHVASTAVGNTLNMTVPQASGIPSQRQISGVAPHANIISYKACEDEETCRGTWLKAALDQAVADGVDVINYSIGGTPRDPWSSSDSLAMLAAREAGVVVVVAAGNEGPGASTVTGPGDAPWVVTAANATHDRATVNRLVDLSGGATAPPSGGVLIGASNTGGYGPRALVRDPAFPLCSQGNDLDSNATGVSNPWSFGRFSGEIVVCERGVQARVAKSANVRLAGGGGMVLLNTQTDGESVVADSHSLPSTHLGFAAATAFKQWLSSGSGHQGRIEGVKVENIPEFGDVLSASSGRGPVATAGVLKPDLTAPGSSILAASRTGTGGTFLSGTSMASPHIAGASALLIAAKPNWTPSQVESALLTTARASVRRQDGVTAATPLDAGSGATDVGKALAAGLSFDVTPAQFRAASPALGGSPRSLNRPSVLHEDCFETCSISRRVTDLSGGSSWRVEVDLPSPASATVTPSTFTLAAGQSADIAFSFDVSDAAFPGAWVNGRVRFVRTGGAPASNAELPLALFASPGAVPAKIDLTSAGESGFQDLPLGGLVSLPQANFAATEFVAPVVTEKTIGQDPTRDDRYDGFGTGNFFNLIEVPGTGAGASVFALTADTRSSTSYDVDLFVGADFDGDGAPDESEELCASTGPRDDERCELILAAESSPTRYWVLVQNWDSGTQGELDAATATDAIVLETALVPLDGPTGDSLTVTGPGHTDSLDPFEVRMAWDDPTLLPGERRVGFLRLGTTPAHAGQLGVVPVELKRAAAGEDAAAVLAPNAMRRMRLGAGRAHEKLYLDVPPNASSLTVDTSGSGEVDLYLARADAPASPLIASAPARGMAAGTSIHAGAEESITLTGAALRAGRWYVTPVNVGTTTAEFDLGVDLKYASARPAQKFGAYFNPARSGAGLFLFPAAGQWSLVWYTYLQDGTPTWYLGVAPAPGAQDGVWRVNLDRYSWDGETNTGRTVGEAQLSLDAADGFTFSFNLDGESGSEPMRWIDGGGCASIGGAPAPVTGMWYSPSRPGFGYAIGAFPSVETNALYFYDDQGIARWALGSVAPFGSGSFPMQQYDGFCPLCDYRDPPTRTIGSVTRRYDSASAGSIGVTLQLAAPLQGNWDVTLPAERLTDALQCQ